MENIKRFDIANLLKTEEEIQDFLNETAQTGEASDFIHALEIATRAKGMQKIRLTPDFPLGASSMLNLCKRTLFGAFCPSSLGIAIYASIGTKIPHKLFLFHQIS